MGLLTTTWLFCSSLLRPVSIVAMESNSNGTIRERKVSLLALATFSWLDPVILKGLRKRLELRDIWRLVETDTSRKILGDYATTA